jgi:hypothetical protein
MFGITSAILEEELLNNAGSNWLVIVKLTLSPAEKLDSTTDLKAFLFVVTPVTEY